MRGTRRFAPGSEWRKWDLHVHPPETHLHDAYKAETKDAAWERFCRHLSDSDVAVYGIADYFSFDGFFSAKKRLEKLHPKSEKVLLPNLGLRLNETVNGERQEVHIHVLLRPDLDEDTAKKLLSNLKTEISDAKRDRPLTCDELTTTDQRGKATVSRDSIKKALERPRCRVRKVRILYFDRIYEPTRFTKPWQMYRGTVQGRWPDLGPAHRRRSGRTRLR